MIVLAEAHPAELAPGCVPEPESGSTEYAVVAIVMDFVGATLPQFDEFLERMQLSSGGPGRPGSIFQCSDARTTESVSQRSGIRIVTSKTFSATRSPRASPRPASASPKSRSARSGYLSQRPAVAENKERRIGMRTVGSPADGQPPRGRSVSASLPLGRSSRRDRGGLPTCGCTDATPRGVELIRAVWGRAIRRRSAVTEGG